MSTYRAIETTADGGFALVERELKNPGPGQVRIAVEATARTAATRSTSPSARRASSRSPRTRRPRSSRR
ncbi:MAG: hypothetical protein ACRDN0_34105 [Trebonia sp.]